MVVSFSVCVHLGGRSKWKHSTYCWSHGNGDQVTAEAKSRDLGYPRSCARKERAAECKAVSTRGVGFCEVAIDVSQAHS